MVVVLSNEMRISCRRSCQRPHKPSFHSALVEPTAHDELRAHLDCRLHARVRPSRHRRRLMRAQ
jgi:hypothetical protein